MSVWRTYRRLSSLRVKPILHECVTPQTGRSTVLRQKAETAARLTASDTRDVGAAAVDRNKGANEKGLCNKGRQTLKHPQNDCLAIGSATDQLSTAVPVSSARSFINDVVEGTDEIDDHDSRAG